LKILQFLYVIEKSYGYKTDIHLFLKGCKEILHFEGFEKWAKN